MNKTLVILAAGMGSRYGGLKQMDPVGPSGEFLLDYAVYDAIEAGFNRVVFVIREGMVDEFNSTVGARINAHVPVEYVFQNVLQVPAGVFAPATRKKPWGTGHALLVARDAVRTPFVAINADDFYGRSAFDIASSFFVESSDDASFAIVG
jgi:choline kinase